MESVTCVCLEIQTMKIENNQVVYMHYDIMKESMGEYVHM